jgi:quinol monooxygenase YgiN
MNRLMTPGFDDDLYDRRRPMRSGIRLLLGLAMSALGVTPAAPADDATVCTVTYVEVVPPSTARGTVLLRQYREAGRKERDNLRIEVLQRIDRPNQFTVLAAWTNKEEFEAHAAAAAARTLGPSSRRSSSARATSEFTTVSSSAPRRQRARQARSTR